jgi:hypothetical protein
MTSGRGEDRRQTPAFEFAAAAKKTLSRAAFLVSIALLFTKALSLSAGSADSLESVPESLRGPFVLDPAVMRLLDTPDGEGIKPLNFTRLLEARLDAPPGAMTDDNPFLHDVGKPIVETITADIIERARLAGLDDRKLNPLFLVDPNSRVQLVGVVNRMDRQFLKETQRAAGAQRNCGEISLIYRFFYDIRDHRQKSRLPVTMNLVFPALPNDTGNGRVTCASIAQRWLDEMARSPDRPAEQRVHDLMDPNDGPLAFLSGKDLERLELNVQAYRAPASAEQSADFGTRAEYIIRIFQWNPKTKQFEPEFLNNQIDRDALVCSGPNDSDCSAKQALRAKLVTFLQRPAVVSDIDYGEVDIDQGLRVATGRKSTLFVLSKRGVSVTPGGAYRTANQPFWNGRDANAGGPAMFDQQIISDEEIKTAMDNAIATGRKLDHIGDVRDFRVRLNEATCTGCHQTRAIAGFHFPGVDRPDTPDANAVYLGGSPHFYGDQPRRIGILRALAEAGPNGLPRASLATGYSDRPDERFAPQFVDTEYLGGWGAACTTNAPAASRRQWSCKADLTCRQVFEGKMDPNSGVCAPPDSARQIGDPLQFGTVESKGFDCDRYVRSVPNPRAKDYPLIPVDALAPPLPAPASGNSYYGAHQEFFAGDPGSADKAVRRDAQTGGFPGGMLRLSECLGLPTEATCGLVAADGFNDCIARMSTDEQFNTNVCFEQFTVYAGLRACSASAPCRDDYICVHPISGYDSLERGKRTFDERRSALEHPTDPDGRPIDYRQILGKRAYDPKGFGEQRPDDGWISRHDGRGYCIPPYFVFQFRSDGHPPPGNPLPTKASSISAGKLCLP